MLNTTRTSITMGITLLLFAALGAPGQNYEVDWHIVSAAKRMIAGRGEFTLTGFGVDGGGGTSSGGEFAVYVNIGQSDAGPSVGGDFEIDGGQTQPPAGHACGDCPTDVDGNGTTDAFDLANLLGAWGPVTPDSECLDADGDGTISALDLAVVLGAWGPCP